MSKKTLSHSLRVTVRFTTGIRGAEAIDVDVALPAGARLADALPEVCRIAGVSPPVSPWEARTAAGTIVDPALPLAWSVLRHGDILTIQDVSGDTEPLLCGDTEALTQVHRVDTRSGFTTWAIVAGHVMMMVLIARSWVALSVGALVSLAIGAGMRLVWKDDLNPHAAAAMSVCGSLTAAVAGISVTSSFVPVEGFPTISAVSVATAAVAALVATAAARISTAPPLGVTVCQVTAWAVVGIWSLIALVLRAAGIAPPAGRNVVEPVLVSGAALTAMVSLIVLIYGPLLAIRVAGIKIPPVPSAGANLASTDFSAADYADARGRAREATTLFDGIVTGTSISGAVATLVAMAGAGAPAFRVLCASVIAAVCVIHSVRHASAVCAWAVWVWGIVAAVSTTAVAWWAGGASSMAVVGLAATVATLFLTSGLWSQAVPNLPPTTIASVEKIESACVIILLPVSLHLAGVFAAIRGLG